MNDPYKVLGVRRNAKPEAIERAYAKAAKRTHPDRNGGDSTAFHDVDLAYRVLSDPERRKRYDETGEIDQPRIADSPSAEAKQLISGLLCIVIRELAAMGLSTDTENVLEHIRQRLKAMQDEGRESRRKMETLHASLKTAADRFAVDSGDNLLAGMARFHVAAVDAELASIDVSLGKVEMALLLLAKHKYRVDKRDDIFSPGAWRGEYARPKTPMGAWH